ncbi:MAG: hypothetical protein RJA22_101 [Verrucomicrobiota bacterium]
MGAGEGAALLDGPGAKRFPVGTAGGFPGFPGHPRPMSQSLEELLEQSRAELLDLSTRNRLLALPGPGRAAKVLHVRDERSAEVYRLLVTEGKALSFLPGRPPAVPAAAPGGVDVLDAAAESKAEDTEETGLPQPEEQEEIPSGGPARRHVDSRLQTALSPEALQTRLLSLYRDARTMLEEQGVNILYLALGQLVWFEADKPATPRLAPLVLVPVALGRRTAADRFFIQWLGEEVQENLSLRAKLQQDFGLELPAFPVDEEFDLPAYLQAVAGAVQGQPGWEVRPDGMALGFFSFAKFLMYRDLDPACWPEDRGLLAHPLVAGLLRDGFPAAEPSLSEAASLDEAIPVTRLDHVVDADSSQTLAIEAVREGRSLVIQGPPGTGKSQSICNLIATAVLDGKRVLFVSEKLAALEVVQRRLQREGLGDLCLELHSHKSNKRAVLEEIARTWQLTPPRDTGLEALVPRLERRREGLNRHVQLLHESRLPSGLNPYAVLGGLARLGRQGETAAAGVEFPDALAWTREDLEERRQWVAGLAGRIAAMGLPAAHPWRGVTCPVVLNTDLPALGDRIRSLVEAVAALREAAGLLAAGLGQPAVETVQAIQQLVRVGQHVGTAPAVDRQALVHGVWDAGLEGLQDLLAEGEKFRQATAALEGRVTEVAWEQDLAPARAQIAAHGGSWLRFLNGDYRRALAALRGVAVGPLPKGLEARLALADSLVAGQRALRALQAGDSLGQAAFGSLWRRERTAWAQAGAVLDWVRHQREAGLGGEFRRVFAGVTDPARVAELARGCAEALRVAQERWEGLGRLLQLDYGAAFGVAEPGQVPLATLAERAARWMEALEELSRWNQYHAQAGRARAAGCAALVERLEDGRVPAGEAAVVFDRIYLTQAVREFMRRHPELAQFDGVQHEQHRDEFRQLDRERLRLSRYRVLAAHADGLPAGGGVGPAGIVQGEMERKRGHRPVRRLLADAGSIVQAIKPVFMMSPLSVAQFLAPGAVEFDLLVIDEASQVQPVDALGAIARCRQIVVVGDSRQLPPTRFFSRMTSNAPGPEAEDESGAAQVADLESILGLCLARGLPQRMLRWHYRSRHHSLIAVSNREFYDSRLFIVPSPQAAAAHLGLRFHPVPDGVFDSGGTGSNRVEARAVAQAVLEHARRDPGLSLGVAAFSVAQQQAILDELELLRRAHPGTEPFFTAHPDEPFFVKNLENVQGDERDVIFISVGYGRNAQGEFFMRFGPLGQAGGERRLNVLITRAKRRCEVFSSITAEDIDLARAPGRGVAALRTFLHYARTGQLDATTAAGPEPGSEFEEAVQAALTGLGHTVDRRVGVAGFYVDLAVRDPRQPGRYLVGIECDGPTYQASRSARDRDRLRQSVLEGMGWTLHRLWSTDWFQRPEHERRRVQEAIERAQSGPAPGATLAPLPVVPAASAPPSPAAPAPIPREAGSSARGADDLGGFAQPYREASFRVPSGRDPHELDLREMADLVLRIVRAEGPVHEEEVVVRVRDLWGLGRAGSRVQDAVAAAIQSLRRDGRCQQAEGFLHVPGEPVVVRRRDDVSSPGLRKPELLPPAEIAAAILALIDAHHGATTEELPTAVARVFGFKSTSPLLRAAVEDATATLRAGGVLSESGGMLKRSTPA